MTIQATAQEIDNSEAGGPVVPVSSLPEEQQQRAAFYGLIAAMLRSAPDREMLQRVAQLSAVTGPQDELGLSMSMLGLAARSSTPEAVDDEFHDLFIGIGRGELMPYASWYLTGFLMEKPLGELRDHLSQLGFQRNPQVCEPEDHLAALCEVMAMLIQEDRPFDEISQFFEAHLATWCDRFFDDLCNADGAVFYRNLGRFGTAFLSLESRYFSMQV